MNSEEKILFDNGFRYDEEDNLWYDEKSARPKYDYRIGISKNKDFMDLYKGGYGNFIGRFYSAMEVLQHIAPNASSKA